MNLIVKAVQDAMEIIPHDILYRAFILHRSRNDSPLMPMDTLESAIIAKVIKKRVVPDAQIAMGEHMIVPLHEIGPKYIDTFRCVYEIPSSKLQYKTILSVLSVSYTPFNAGIGSFGAAYGGVGPMFTNDVMTAAQQMVEASSAIPNVMTAKVELIGENTVLIEDAQRFNTAYHLSCYVTDSEYLNKIDPRYYEQFSTLCEYAIKAGVYRRLVLEMGRAHIEGGTELGVFKEIADTYSDAETNYRTFLKEKWKKIAYMANRDRYYRYIKMQIPTGL